MNRAILHNLPVVCLLLLSCQPGKDTDQLKAELQSANVLRGEIALCGAGEGKFGKVGFGTSCFDQVREDLNLAIALLHSFEYGEAEKVFARVIDADPRCLMAYWGVAMSNFHPLWAPPTREELAKGSKIVSIARSLDDQSERERDYLEAIAVIFDDWQNVDHYERVLRFEKASELIYRKYPEDKEAAIFYALATRAAADPADKTFARQKKAGEILNAIFPGTPDHPGIAHYLIHTYDYPELASLALPAARKYASIASASAHALHMPSHIFTRLGLWDEAIQSNLNSVAAARCYAETSGMQGHWDEELHGIDYLVYAYLQKAEDDSARSLVRYVTGVDTVAAMNGKTAYTIAAVPTRYALERKEWEEAIALELKPGIEWKAFPWERALVSFGRVLGAVHLRKMDVASEALEELRKCESQLLKNKKSYEANQVAIQITASEAWMKFYSGDKETALSLMEKAADMEDATEKHPVTPGEVVPARELLGDMHLEAGNFQKAREAYDANLLRHAGRLNGLYGAAVATTRTGDREKAKSYFEQLMQNSGLKRNRPQLSTAGALLTASR